MWITRKVYERLVSEAALALVVPKLELRTERVEDALAKERIVHQQETRHWASMFLRRSGSYPLTPTADEKAEVKAERTARLNQPPTLTADQSARREAVRAWAKTNGFSQEDADKSFAAQLGAQVDE